MTPTEHEATVAVDAAARRFWKAQQDSFALQGAPGALEDFDALDRLQQVEVKQHVLPFVWAALEALPDRTLSLREEWGRRIKDGSLGEGHMVGRVTAVYRTEEGALLGNPGGKPIHSDSELVVRRVTEWEAAR